MMRHTIFKQAVCVVFFSLIFYVQASHAAEQCSSYSNLSMKELPGSCDPEWTRDLAQCPDCFQPNFDFPQTLPVAESLPWNGIDFTDPHSGAEEFLQAVLGYVLEGFEGDNRNKWNVFENEVRTWYHAPWLHPHDHDGSGDRIIEIPSEVPIDLPIEKYRYDPVRTGREYLMGLTEELQSGPHSLGLNQEIEKTNWAVSFYNPRAAHTLWNIWNDGTNSPEIKTEATEFAAGSVFAKPLYTTVTEDEAGFLTGAPTAHANVSAKRFEVWNRNRQKVRLIQFDVAVKFDRATFEQITGLKDTYTWVYGTFVYNGLDRTETDPWKKLRPIGLSWGSDPQLSDCSGGTVEQSVVLLNASDLEIDIGDTKTRESGRAKQKPCLEETFGREGRMNGPVDNPISSCHSCHTAAQYRVRGFTSEEDEDPTLKVREPWPYPWPVCKSGKCTQEELDAFWARDKCLFTNRNLLTPLGDKDTTKNEDCWIDEKHYVSTDTALQVSFGLLNFCRFTIENLSTKTKEQISADPKLMTFYLMGQSCDERLKSEPPAGGIRAFNLAEPARLDELLSTLKEVRAGIPSNLVGKGGPTQ